MVASSISIRAPIISTFGERNCVSAPLNLRSSSHSSMFALSSIEHQLRQVNSVFSGRIEWFREIGSTNDEIMKSDDFHGKVCIAGLQTAGRGRRGREWSAPFGSSVLMSIGWTVEQHRAAGLSLVCGLAVQRALVELGVADVMLKWPNDVLLNNHKIAGILLELSGDTCVIGIGLNVNIGVKGEDDLNPERQMPVSTGLPWSDLRQQGYNIDYNQLVIQLLLNMGDALTEFDHAGFSGLVGAWNEVHAYHHQMVSIVSRDVITGRVLGVTATGAIRLETAAGEKEFYSGDVSLRPISAMI